MIETQKSVYATLHPPVNEQAHFRSLFKEGFLFRKVKR